MKIVPAVQLVLFVVIVVNWHQPKLHVKPMDVFGVRPRNLATHGAFIPLRLHQPLRHLLPHHAMSAILTSVIVALLVPLSPLVSSLVAAGNRPTQAHRYHGVTSPNKKRKMF